jgi:hypothetical protein
MVIEPRCRHFRRVAVRSHASVIKGDVALYTRIMAGLKKYGLEPDPVIEEYKRGVDRTLLREHLKLTPQQRLERLVAFMRGLDELRRAANRP